MTQLSDDDFVDESDWERPRKSSGLPGWALALIICCGLSVLVAPVLILVALLVPAVQQAREAARRTQARNNLKQIGLAMYNFHDVHQHFPPMHTVGDGSDLPPHSWMTDILPFVDQAPLYNSISQQVAWDDPSNRTAFQSVVETYLNPSESSARMDARGYALAHVAANSRVVSDGKQSRMHEIHDGLANTFLVGQVDAGFKPWGDPTNHRDPKAGVGGGPQAFGSPHVNVVHVLMADGSVRVISKDIDPNVFEMLGDPTDGQAVPDDGF